MLTQEKMLELAKAMQGVGVSAGDILGGAKTITTVDYNLDEEPKQDVTMKTKPTKPKTPLKNRMKQLGRR